MRAASILLLAAGLAACDEEPPIPVLDVPPTAVVTVAHAGEDQTDGAPSKGAAPLGTGWYANVEVDAQDRIHVAWTNADKGDVKYAVTAPGATTPQGAEIVDQDGSVGSFLRLALTPDGQPVLAYYHQDEHMLRLAHLEAPPSALSPSSPSSPARPGAAAKVPPPLTWVKEDVAFGDQAGLAGSLVVDGEGRPHLLYYVKGERLRYARRPAELPGFGGAAQGIFEKVDVDAKAGGTSRITTDLAVAADGTVLATYCDWGIVDAVLKLGLRTRGQGAFQVFEGSKRKTLEGWSSSILTKSDGTFDVASLSSSEHVLSLFSFDPKAPGPPASKTVVVRRAGPSVARRTPDGTLFVLTRALADPAVKEDAGLTLYELPGGDASKARRWILERGDAADSWFDLAIRKNGRPVAVWASPETKSLRLYAP